MGYHPLNLVLRFILVVCALMAVGFWGLNQTDNSLKFVLAIGLPIILAVIWGVFAVPNDKSRSGKAPVPTPGILRLALELVIFVFATWCLYSLGYHQLYIVFGVVIAIHYILSYDRIAWLLSK